VANDDIQVFGQASARAHYVPALGHAGLVFTSGQLPFLPDGSHGADRSFDDQARQVLDNLDRVLATAGTSRGRVLHVTAFLVGIDHWDAFNRIYAGFFGDWRPTRTVVPVPNLHFGYLLEVEAVAAAGCAA
jgi:2-iminobutanoate/2-iminopropanoate deaminase